VQKEYAGLLALLLPKDTCLVAGASPVLSPKAVPDCSDKPTEPKWDTLGCRQGGLTRQRRFKKLPTPDRLPAERRGPE
jgi:hypothetical protein